MCTAFDGPHGEFADPEPAGFTHFRGTLDIVEQHLLGPRGHVMPALSLSPAAIDDVVGFRFMRDRRLYREHVLPYRERRAGYPNHDREASVPATVA